ncbi:putative hemicentin-2-like [Penaeus vannamei]|uniref:Putative hemicentin-2-like n=1 Tax=Penaeus vannamei TaxID=6689 RepID=A0A423TTQ6_PENVA|nr:putative hemicentin-2-like [Penaeus vannamei]
MCVSMSWLLHWTFTLRADGKLRSSAVRCMRERRPLTEVWGVVGGKVLLPCDMNPPLQNDSTHLVLFYHGALGTPIYSLDSRGKSLEHASHWAEQDLGHRAVMRVNRKQHGLLLEDIQLKDQGMYRCRVDFVESPTRNVRVRLRVVVPPTCVGQQQLTYGAARHETLEVPCQVKAHPMPRLLPLP